MCLTTHGFFFKLIFSLMFFYAAEINTKNVYIFTSGFKETGEEEGIRGFHRRKWK